MCDNTVSVIATYNAKITPIQSGHHIKAWPRHLHCGLAFPQPSPRKQRLGNCKNEYKHNHHQHLSENASLYNLRRYTGSNIRIYTPARTKGIHNTRLATQERRSRAHDVNIGQ